MRLGLRMLLCMSRWIRVEITGLDDASEQMGQSGRAVGIIANSTSLMDTLLMMAYGPAAQVHTAKMLTGTKYGRIPFFGTLLRAWGAAFINTKKKKVAEIDKIRMDMNARSLQAFEEHVLAGGTAVWFPEGQMNRYSPLELGCFRPGPFCLPLRVDMELWCAAFVGVSDCWPSSALLGGRPARIKIALFKLCDSSHALVSEALGSPGAEDMRAATAWLANTAHDAVQVSVNVLAFGTESARRGKE